MAKSTRVSKRCFKPCCVADLFARAISESKWVEICTKCSDVIEEFHQLGMVHGDLHPGNIVIVLDKIEGFQPYLIDFAFSTHLDEQEETLEELEDLGVRFVEDFDYSQEGDIERLTKSLVDICQDLDNSFLKGVRALGG